ncbi:RNA recognition motif [Trifolium medium]|uniref:RNA recognition motif n=1 Tax=Trifolium medium TaxID=97028 RepID=A0A392M2Y3_9FABA|nr:RNA recognition motif [Trifolium medium]
MRERVWEREVKEKLVGHVLRDLSTGWIKKLPLFSSQIFQRVPRHLSCGRGLLGSQGWGKCIFRIRWRGFGFVKFREVTDAIDLLRRVSNIWLGSFKLRINLSKFAKNSKPPAIEEDRARRTENHQVVSEKSFRNVLVDEVAVDVRGSGTSVVAAEKDEVVWEVEVEDEVTSKLTGAYVGYLVEDKDPLTIQNNFRMGGFPNLKVSALGFMKVLLWSDKVGEVKEMVEAVGWWCSLFDKVVPWSPDLIINERVTWIRCYGVPLHAWGNDLFRSIAFKSGRFIGVDEKTKHMLRCDVASLKIVTGGKKFIDSSMVVKVKGQRFEIRVLEETGSLEDDGRWCGGVCRCMEEEISSKASSGGGCSAVAVVEGLSESGSDADVSESCEVLLGFEKHGRERSEFDGSLGKQTSVVEKVAEDTPHFLENTVELVDSRVNSEVDKGKAHICLESADVEKVLENVGVGPPPDPVNKEHVDGDSSPKSFNDVEGEEVRNGACVGVRIWGVIQWGPTQNFKVISGDVVHQSNSCDSIESFGEKDDFSTGACTDSKRGRSTPAGQNRSAAPVNKQSANKKNPQSSVSHATKVTRLHSSEEKGVKKKEL